MKTILVPVDFSDTSLNAARYALQFAKQAGAKVILLHAFQEPVRYPVRGGLELTKEGLWEVNLDQLRQLQAQFEKAEPFVKTDILHLNGSLPEVIAQVEESMQIQLVIMGITGAGKVRETLIGSNTLAVARQTNLPVIIVPEHARFETVTDVGLTTDFRDVADTIPDKKIKEIVYMLGSRLHVLNVDYQHSYSTPDTPFQSGLVETMFQELTPHYHFIEHENIAEGLNDYAATHGIELLIAIPQKHNLLDRLFSKSQTKELVFHSKLPVMVLHD
ncbi:MAG TPA: universal stress protein [Lacibacter sp.]|nr:universal stress protein [Lacibacter sp.]HMO89641.1 universal stress protein [Lacibacter sp.]